MGKIGSDGGAVAENGMPEGGTSGQIIVKQSATNYDIEWQDQPGAGFNTVANVASLPAAADHTGEFYVVLNSTGFLWTQRKGTYYSDGASWSRLSRNTLAILTNAFSIRDNTDTTKELPFNASELTTSTARTITMPDSDVDLGDIATNATHATGDGSDHANVALNDAHRAGDGSDHADVAANSIHVAGDGSDHADVAANTSKLAGIENGADVTDSTNVDAAGAVMESDYNANTILKADSDSTPSALTVAEQRIIGRITAGVVTALTAAQVRTLLNVEDGATADQSDSEIETAYNNQVALVSEAQAQDDENTTVYRWTPQRVHDAIKQAFRDLSSATEPSSPATNDLWIDTSV